MLDMERFHLALQSMKFFGVQRERIYMNQQNRTLEGDIIPLRLDKPKNGLVVALGNQIS